MQFVKTHCEVVVKHSQLRCLCESVAHFEIPVQESPYFLNAFYSEIFAEREGKCYDFHGFVNSENQLLIVDC